MHLAWITSALEPYEDITEDVKNIDRNIFLLFKRLFLFLKRLYFLDKWHLGGYQISNLEMESFISNSPHSSSQRDQIPELLHWREKNRNQNKPLL